jgi:hypothetical protein
LSGARGGEGGKKEDRWEKEEWEIASNGYTVSSYVMKMF